MLRIKQIGTICFAIFSFVFSAPTFATDIPSSASTADCKNNPLQTYSGTSNLQADWQANTIQLHWYNGNDEIQNVPSVSQSCVYDGTLTPPATIPTKTGYTFRGWRVRQCSLSGLDTTINSFWNATYTRWKSIVPADGFTMQDSIGAENSSDLNNGEWAVTFSYGTVKGMAKCSGLSGDNNNYTWSNDSSNWTATESALTSASGRAQYCWCAATGYTPSGGNQCSIVAPSWVFKINSGNQSMCNKDCARECASGLEGSADFRRALFGVSQ